MLVFGYARVSSKGQEVERQIQSIKNYRPKIEEHNIFKDVATGTKTPQGKQSDMLSP